MLRTESTESILTLNFDVVIILEKLNSVAWFPERTIPTEWPQLVGEVSVNFKG
jgi:hypothetical protein